VGEASDLFADPLDHVRRCVAHAHDRDAGAEVDQRVAVDVAQDSAPALVMKTGSIVPTPADTAAVRRAFSSRDRGPGSSVTSWRS